MIIVGKIDDIIKAAQTIDDLIFIKEEEFFKL
jgi:hypothetical protein